MNVIGMINAAIQSDVAELVAASFKDFHAKGLDYICLKRTPNHTVKVYILDGDASKLPEVVNPHDHRYPFRTTVLRGQMVDQRFERGGPGAIYEAFDYLTQLNGGSGFFWRGEERLAHVGRTRLHRFDQLMTAPEMLHTISMEADQTIEKALLTDERGANIYSGASLVCIPQIKGDWRRMPDLGYRAVEVEIQIMRQL